MLVLVLVLVLAVVGGLERVQEPVGLLHNRLSTSQLRCSSLRPRRDLGPRNSAVWGACARDAPAGPGSHSHRQTATRDARRNAYCATKSVL